MGVVKLWSILKDLGEDQDYSYLSGKRIAVDLSGWVCQARMGDGVSKRRESHLSHVFSKVKRLLKEDIHPIFVMEGKMPDLKKRKNENKPEREEFNYYLEECRKLLESLGVPCIKASGEAEAGCAFLYLNQKVDGVVTEDSDALLYGADTVFRLPIDYKKEKLNKDNIKVYSLKSEKNTLKLDRTKLIAVALLLGCDYCDGLQNIGEDTVKKFLELSENKSYDILERFKKWKVMDESHLFPGFFTLKKPTHCERCSHIGSRVQHERNGCDICKSKTCFLDLQDPCQCDWHKSNEYKCEYKIYKAVKEKLSENKEDFPDFKVINEFMNYTDELPQDDALEWKPPNKSDFLKVANKFLPEPKAQNDFVKFMTTWQLNKLSRNTSCDQTNFLYVPMKILSKGKSEKKEIYDVQWISKDSEKQNEVVETEVLRNVFKKLYPELTEAFEQGEAKKPGSKSDKRQLPISYYMPAKKK